MKNVLARLLCCVLLAGLTACALQHDGLRAGWVVPTPASPPPPRLVQFEEGAPLPEIYSNPTLPSSPAIYVQLINAGQTIRRIEVIALNHRLDSEHESTLGAFSTQPFDLAPGEVRFWPMQPFNCALPAWLYVRSRPLRRGRQGNASETIVAMQGVLPDRLPRGWLKAGCQTGPIP